MAVEFRKVMPTLQGVIAMSVLTATPADEWISKLVLEEWYEVVEDGQLIGFTNAKAEVMAIGRAHEHTSNTRHELHGESTNGTVGVGDRPPNLLRRFMRMVARVGKNGRAKTDAPTNGSDRVSGDQSPPDGMAIHHGLTNGRTSVDLPKPEDRH